jgi:glycine/D-amino acid oxidase-like deaminating enzyme
MKKQIIIIGGGIVGACIAYELSTIAPFQVTVLETRSSPGLGCSMAALGICMGIISHKTKGRNWKLREKSLHRYDTLIAELNAEANQTLEDKDLDFSPIPFNDRGIIQLCGLEDDLTGWHRLIQKRSSQGYPLDCWSKDQISQVFPTLNLTNIQAAIYSPQDRQVDPYLLIEALKRSAQKRGVCFRFNTTVKQVVSENINGQSRVTGVVIERNSFTEEPTLETIAVDGVIVASGLGTNGIDWGICPDTQPTSVAHPKRDPNHAPQLDTPVLQAVLGQAWQVSLPQPLWAGEGGGLHPVLNVRDIHFVPILASSDRSLDDQDSLDDQSLDDQSVEYPTIKPTIAPSLEPCWSYWIGATVEFAPECFPEFSPAALPQASETIAQDLWDNATQICPSLAEATIQAQWSGLRPRPINQAAPVLQWSTIASNLLFATGHYRNGVFLAPGTALWVKEQVILKWGALT